MNISSLLPSLDKFKVIPRDTLFEIDCRDAYKGFCPLCGNKIKMTLKKDAFYCNSVKHKKGFYMKAK